MLPVDVGTGVAEAAGEEAGAVDSEDSAAELEELDDEGMLLEELEVVGEVE